MEKKIQTTDARVAAQLAVLLESKPVPLEKRRKSLVQPGPCTGSDPALFLADPVIDHGCRIVRGLLARDERSSFWDRAPGGRSVVGRCRRGDHRLEVCRLAI